MTLYGITVGRNERHRYLATWLHHAARAVDTLFYFDDQSDDGSLELLQEVAATTPALLVARRQDSDPTFLAHEGGFRAAAWRAFEAQCQPREGDWVLAIDTDETVAPLLRGVSAGEALRAQVAAAVSSRSDCVMFHVPEIFGRRESDGWPLIRTDGLWSAVNGRVLFRYRPDAVYADKAMGCGREPTYVAQGRYHLASNVHLLHWGYAHPDDVAAKYQRYSSLVDHGHNAGHIKSIITTPRLQPWSGPIYPEMTRGDTWEHR